MKTINVSTDNVDVYIRPFFVEELHNVLHRAHDTSAGPGEIHYQLLKHLPNSSLLLLLNIFYKIWISGAFPSHWRKTIVITVTRPGKDHTNPTNYRHIPNVQCRFRSRRSTIDHLVRFERFHPKSTPLFGLVLFRDYAHARMAL